VSPPRPQFRIVKSLEGLHAQVLGRIVDRWGEASAEQVRERVEAGTEQEAEAWLRRAAYFPDLESMLDLGRALPVHPLSIHGLLDFLAPGKTLGMSFLLLELAWFPRDWREAERSVPWLADLPQAGRALQHLHGQGWLLIGCEQREQALLLWANVRRGRGVQASRYHPALRKERELTAR
jgi:hypothetical protein